jgi:hypothetical protein
VVRLVRDVNDLAGVRSDEAENKWHHRPVKNFQMEIEFCYRFTSVKGKCDSAYLCEI